MNDSINEQCILKCILGFLKTQNVPQTNSKDADVAFLKFHRRKAFIVEWFGKCSKLNKETFLDFLKLWDKLSEGIH